MVAVPATRLNCWTDHHKQLLLGKLRIPVNVATQTAGKLPPWTASSERSDAGIVVFYLISLSVVKSALVFRIDSPV
ncbi:MAG: hypothetical protein RL563_306, partial [Pseudomonadota bacterium]